MTNIQSRKTEYTIKFSNSLPVILRIVLVKTDSIKLKQSTKKTLTLERDTFKAKYFYSLLNLMLEGWPPDSWKSASWFKGDKNEDNNETRSRCN